VSRLLGSTWEMCLVCDSRGGCHLSRRMSSAEDHVITRSSPIVRAGGDLGAQSKTKFVSNRSFKFVSNMSYFLRTYLIET
jgi:hypothetical protein